MAQPTTDLEFVLGWDPDRVLALLARHSYLSEAGQRRREEVRGMIERAIDAWDPKKTGPSYVHALAAELMRRGLIGPAGVAAHEAGPKPYASQLDAFGIRIGSAD